VLIKGFNRFAVILQTI